MAKNLTLAPTSQPEFFPVDELPADEKDPGTIQVASPAFVTLAPLVAYDIDPRVSDVAAEAERFIPARLGYLSPGLWYSRVPNAVLATDRAVVVCGNRWLTDTVRGFGMLKHWDLRPDNTLVLPAHEMQEDRSAVLLSCAVNARLFNYYHWLFESFARLFVALEAGVDIANTRFVINADAHGVELEALAAAGVAEKQLIRWDGASTRFRLLGVPSRGLFSAATASLMAVNALRRFGTEWIRSGQSDPPRPRRIFISREGATRRRVRNEDKLIAVAEAMGLEAVSLEGKSLADQVALFADAEVVVGPHGAGFANCTFGPPATNLLELFPEGVPRPLVFRHLASCRGQRYAFCVGPIVSGHRSRSWMATDYVINPNRFEEVLSRVLDDAEVGAKIEA